VATQPSFFFTLHQAALEALVEPWFLVEHLKGMIARNFLLAVVI
jgi:hypothetical protein